MSDAAWPLQQALFQALDGNISVSVYDYVPQGAGLPYVVIGPDNVADASTKDSDGHDFTVQIHVWTEDTAKTLTGAATKAGFKEAKQIGGEIYPLLHKQALSVAGFDTVQVRFSGSTSQVESDGMTRRLILFYDILLDKQE